MIMETKINGLDDLPDAQRAGIQEVVSSLEGDERKEVIDVEPVTFTGGRLEHAWATGSVTFTDGTGRPWIIRPNGSYTWRLTPLP